MTSILKSFRLPNTKISRILGSVLAFTLVTGLSTPLASAIAPPVISSIEANSTGNEIVLTFDEALTGTPSSSEFTIENNGGNISSMDYSVAVLGSNVTLTYQFAFASSDTLRVSYSGSSLADSSLNQVVAFGFQNVTNNIDTTAPAKTGIASNSAGTTITITYDEAPASTPVPLAADYAVLVGSTANVVTAVAISGSTVMLTLTTALAYGDVATVAYTRSTGAELQDAAGNFAADFTAAAVTNSVTAPVVTPTIDYAAIAAANAKAAADKLAAEKATAEKAIADAKAAAEKAIADAKAAAEKAIADAKAAAETAVKAAEEKAAEEAAAAVVAAAEKKAAANTVKISSSTKSTKITLNLADKYYGRIAYVQLITKTKTGVKTTTLDYFVIENEDGTANISVKKLAKGQTLQVRIGKTIVFSKSL